jgi:hypothetical protein
MQNRFISLGGDCQPAHHIRRLSAQSTALTFDWLITPVRAVKPLIETGFENMFDREVLSWEEVEDGWHVTDERHNLLAMHQFKSRDHRDVDIVIQKLRERGRAILQLIEEPAPIIFVRRWHSVDLDAGRDEVLDLHAFLTVRKPNCVFLYLQQDNTGQPVIDGTYIVCYSPGALDKWTGDDTIYERNFTLADQIASGMPARS